MSSTLYIGLVDLWYNWESDISEWTLDCGGCQLHSSLHRLIETEIVGLKCVEWNLCVKKLTFNWLISSCNFDFVSFQIEFQLTLVNHNSRTIHFTRHQASDNLDILKNAPTTISISVWKIQCHFTAPFYSISPLSHSIVVFKQTMITDRKWSSENTVQLNFDSVMW